MQPSPYGGIEIQAEELRALIKGDIGARKCPDCGGKGQEWRLHYVLADDPDEIEEDKTVSDQFAADFLVDDYPQYSWGQCFLWDCETCYTVGYVWNWEED